MTDESTVIEPRSTRILDLMDAKYGNPDVQRAAKRRELARLAEAAKKVRLRSPDLIRQGPNPTMDISSLDIHHQVAWRVWWGEETMRDCCARLGLQERHVRPFMRQIEEETGEKFVPARGRKKRIDSVNV